MSSCTRVGLICNDLLRCRPGLSDRCVANLWTELLAQCGYWVIANGNYLKTLINSWWLQLLKWQKLSFLPNLLFGTERSEVRILSPRPVTYMASNIYGLSRDGLFCCLANWMAKCHQSQRRKNRFSIAAQVGKPTRRIKSSKRGSERSRSNRGSTLSQLRDGDRS